jgi:dihydrodipicolinate synthase/N-acetylneuraminate lyase
MEEAERADTEPVMIAGLVGPTGQAREEARQARELGYDCGLLSLAALPEAPTGELVEHVKAVAEILPVFGFYLQRAVGGRRLPYRFWRRFCEIEGAVAVKIAPFDRYRTLDVVRAVADAGRLDEIALYTGNDDHIVADLLTEFPFGGGARIAGGLLGHWAVWTRTAVSLLEEVKAARRTGGAEATARLLRRGAEITDANAAFFDPTHDFAGSIAGIHEVLRRQGLMQGRWTLSPDEQLSAGQMEEIDRVYAAYPHLNDDDFVRTHLKDWLS